MWERNELVCVNPASLGGPGSVRGPGLAIDWGAAPRSRATDVMGKGARMLMVIEAARQRIAFYQDAADGRYRCRQNAIAITRLEEAFMRTWTAAGKPMPLGFTLDTENGVDADGNPTGGHVRGDGISIDWQNGPLGRPPKPATGAFVDDVIEAARQRLEWGRNLTQAGEEARLMSIAITHLEEAALWLLARRLERERRGVQGLHKP